MTFDGPDDADHQNDEGGIVDAQVAADFGARAPGDEGFKINAGRDTDNLRFRKPAVVDQVAAHRFAATDDALRHEMHEVVPMPMQRQVQVPRAHQMRAAEAGGERPHPTVDAAMRVDDVDALAPD